MNRICILALAVCVLGLACVALAQDDGGGIYPYPQNGDPWNYVPQPSGMRFTAAGGTTGMPCCGDYNYCWTGCSCARCAHWTQYSWYAPWCYNCNECYKASGKHEWLH